MNKTIYCIQVEPTDDNINMVMKKYGVYSCGFKVNDNISVSNDTIRFIYDNFEFLFMERTKFSAGSYGAKHYVEDFRKFMGNSDGYVSNGELIIALILRGIPFKYDENSPNCVFKCSYREEIEYLIHKGYTLKNRKFTN